MLCTEHDRGEPQQHRPEQQQAPQVVAVADEQHGAPHALGLLDEGDERRDQHRRAETSGRPDVRREHGGDRDREGADGAAQHLDRQPDLEETPKAGPLLPCGVPVAVLDDHLVDRQVDEQLQQARDAEDEGESRKVVLRQLAGGDNRGSEAENRRPVDPESRRRTTPEEARGHLTGRV